MNTKSIRTARSSCMSISYDAIIEYVHPSLIHRLQKKCKLSADSAIELFDDTKRFLYLCADSNSRMTPPPAIDECWHHFILFTKDYAEFCERFLGGFVHHRPHYIGDPPSDESTMFATIESATRDFGILSKNWQFPEDFRSHCDKCAGCQAD